MNTTTRGRALKRRKTVVTDEDDFSQECEAEEIDEGMSSIELPSLIYCSSRLIFV